MEQYFPAPGPTKAEFNSLSSDVSTLNTKISPSFSTEGLTFNGCSYVSGGYFKIGKLVVIQIRLEASNDTSFTVTGFPRGVGDTLIGGWPPKMGDEVVNFQFRDNGVYLFTYGTVTSGNKYGVTCVYLAA